MRVCGINSGSNRSGRLTEQIRRFYNHHVTETISFYRLRHLPRGTEQLWVCPECQNIGS